MNYKLIDNPFCEGITELYCITEKSVKIGATLMNPKFSKIYYTVPIFIDNGRDLAEVKFYDNRAETVLNNDKYSVVTDGELSKSPKTCLNRNGKYHIAMIEKEGTTINLELVFEHLSDFKLNT